MPGLVLKALLAQKATLFQRGHTWYFNLRHEDKQFRISLRTNRYRDALNMLEDVIAKRILNEPDPSRKKPIPSSKLHRYKRIIDDSWKDEIKRASKNTNSWLGYIYQRAKDRGRRKGIYFNLTHDELVTITERSNGKCEVSNIPFSWELWPNSTIAPFAPSLDRITSGLGYTKNNIRLVCTCVNAAMGGWGDGVIHRIILASREAGAGFNAS